MDTEHQRQHIYMNISFNSSSINSFIYLFIV